MKKNNKGLFGILGTLLILFLTGFLLVNGVAYYSYAVKKTALKDGTVFIPSSTSSIEEQAGILFREGFIRDSAEYVLFADKRGYDKIYPGKYTIREGMTYRQLLGTIGANRQTPVNVTFNNIRTFEKLAAAVSKYIEPDSAALASFFLNPKTAREYGFSPETFLGMFIPNTYEFYWDTTPEEFTGRMKKEYDKFWNDSRNDQLEELNMTRQQVSILASIVIEESKYEPEMPRIAGVYINRLRKGMPLQADPTVKFALKDPGIKRILFKHLEVDSPYNTYKHAGLPPGVICMPPIAAIDAVLNYETHDYLYFCATPDLSGKHVFAKNLAAHNANARAYAAALNRQGIR